MNPTLYIQVAGGLVYLLWGGDLLVRGAVALARRLHVSPMVIALTVVAFGTSLPELVVVLRAALTGYPGLVLGNVVGSNTANVLLILGITALIHPITYGERSVRRDSVILIAASVLVFLACWNGLLGPTEGGLMLGCILVYTAVTAREAARAYRSADLKAPLQWVLGLPNHPVVIGVFIVLGVIWLPLGAYLVVEASVRIAAELGVSDTVVGLTILAFGTSLPELATTVAAARQKRTEVAVGTVIGSNTFNLLAILGVAAVVSPDPVLVPLGFLALDLPVMLAAALLVGVFVWVKRPIGRSAGALFVAGYLAYIVTLVLRALVISY